MADPWTAHWYVYVPGVAGIVSVCMPDENVGVAPTSGDANDALWRALSRFVHVTIVPGGTVIVDGWYAVA